ncbi:MAG: hypothetical protein ABEH90_09370 [Halolamina sp.]
MSLREQVPKPLRGPVGFGSLAVMIVFIAVGYVLTTLGITMAAGLSAPQGLSFMESVTVMVIGMVCLIISYLGWKGFNYFAY